MVLSEVKGYHKWETGVGGSERLQIYLSWKRNWWWFIAMPIVVYIKVVWDSCVDLLPAYDFRECLCFSPASKGYILNVCLVLIFDFSMIQNLARNFCLHFVKVWLAYGFWLLGIGLEGIGPGCHWSKKMKVVAERLSSDPRTPFKTKTVQMIEDAN